MKKRFKLLVALVLSLTMMLGMNISILAAEVPIIDGDDPSKSYDTGIMDIDDSMHEVMKISFDTLDNLIIYENTYINDIKFDLFSGEITNINDNPLSISLSPSLVIDNLNEYASQGLLDLSDFGGGELVYKERIKWNWIDGKRQRSCYYYTTTYSPKSDPTPAKEEAPVEVLVDRDTYKSSVPSKKEAPVEVLVDRDTYKSSVPSKTVTLLNSDGKLDMDMKVHPSSEKSIINQKFLATTFAKQLGKTPKIILTEDVFMRNDLLTSRYGQKDALAWNNLNYKVPGPIYAVVYNQTDGAYLISGTIDANGNAKLNDFIFRPASTITIFVAN